MNLPRLAIVGTGIAGLGTAYFLRDRFNLTLFEQADYAGGHTNTIDVPERGGVATFDTGFMVFNRVTYPLLCRLFEELQVPTKPTSMSFSVQHLPSDLEFCGSGWNELFAQRSNLVRPRFWRLLSSVNRFNQEAYEALQSPRWTEMSLGDYVRQRGYGEDFLHFYLIPMSSAVWSTPPEGMLEFPAATLLRFFHNHGFLGLHTQHPWWTVEGGAREYVRRIDRILGKSVRLNARVKAVNRPQTGGATIITQDGHEEHFDKVVLATHADQALGLLTEPTQEESKLLGAFKYQPNLAIVHTDTSVMPRARRAWASWNYRVESADHRKTQTVYWMNSLQGVSRETQYFVSINGEESIDRNRILRKIYYDHPLFNLEAMRAQRELPQLNLRSPQQPVYFAGSYFRYGFHEDALGSALACAEAVSGNPIWK